MVNKVPWVLTRNNVACCSKLCLWWCCWWWWQWFSLQSDLEETKSQTASWPVRTIAGATKVTANHDWFLRGALHQAPPLNEGLKKKKKKARREKVYYHSIAELFVILKHVPCKGDDCVAVPSLLPVGRGRGEGNELVAHGQAAGTVLIVL